MPFPAGTSDGWPDLLTAREGLIVKPSSLGDIVHTLPAVASLKERFPHLSLRWIANTEWVPLLEGNRLLAEVIPFPRRAFRGLGALRACPWFSRLRHRRPDVALDFQGLLRSALMARASRAGFVAGLSDAREAATLLYSRTVAVDPGAHAVDRYLALVRAFGAEGEAPATAALLPEGKRPATLLPERFVMLHPFARGRGKALTPDQIATLVRLLAPEAVVMVGVSGGGLRSPWPSAAIDLLDQTTLLELVWLMRQAAFVISVDSGPMHLASALERPLLGIHTWSDPRKVGPYSRHAWIWKGGQLARRNEIDSALAARSDSPTDSDLAAMAAHVGRFLAADPH